MSPVVGTVGAEMGVNLGLLWILGANAATTVFVPLGPLVRPPVEAPERAPVGHIADELVVTVRPGDETGLTLTWRLSPLSPGWVDLPLVGGDLAISEARVEGRALTLTVGSDRMYHLPLYLERPVTVTVRGTVKTPASALRLRALGGVRQRVEVEGPWEISAPDAVRLPGGRLIGGDRQRLDLDWRPQGPPAEKPPLLRADAASAARVDSGGVELEAVLRYRVVRGSFDTLAFRLAPGAEDLDVSGDGVTGFSRSGDVVTVTLGRPLTDHLDLRVRCRRGGVSGEVPVPWPVAAEVKGYTTLNRGDESLIVPDPEVGATPVGVGSLPPWARGLLEGEPIVSYQLSGEAPRVAVRSLRWEPIDGPPTVVDEARYEVATADHGRLLLRARYQVRNDRRQFLRMRAPEGFQLVSVMVAGRMVQPARDEDGTLLIPLEKSVETLQGLVTFPVDVAFLGEEAPWARRGERIASTPSIDAPIAYARWELLLPPGYSGEVEHSTATSVPDWSSRSNTLQYGHAYGDKTIEGIDAGVVVLDGLSTGAEEASQQAWNEAYRAYKENRFEDSRDLIQQSLAYNPSNQAAAALSGNLDVLLSEEVVTGEAEVAARRVKDMARAKTGQTERQQEVLQAKADEAIRAGDYEEAEKTLEELVKVSGVLASVEQAESVDKKAVLSSSSSQLATVKEELKNRRGGYEYADSGGETADVGRSSVATSTTTTKAESTKAPPPKPAEKVKYKPVTEIAAEAPPPVTSADDEDGETTTPVLRRPVGSSDTNIDFAAGGFYDAESAPPRDVLWDGRNAPSEPVQEIFGRAGPMGADAWVPDASGASMDQDYDAIVDEPVDHAGLPEPAMIEVEGQQIQIIDPSELDPLIMLGYTDEGAGYALATPEIPVSPGYATVILNDPQAADDIANSLVLEPDIAALLYATDVTGFTGDEGLNTEVVIRGIGVGGVGSSASGYGSGYGQGGIGQSSTRTGATTAGVVVPRAGTALKFEARLVPEGQPLQATISYRAARDR